MMTSGQTPDTPSRLIQPSRLSQLSSRYWSAGGMPGLGAQERAPTNLSRGESQGLLLISILNCS